MTIIDIKNVWKRFRLYYEKKPSLKETLLLKGRGRWDEFWVLKNINFQIEKGATVGLIGENGSGKSTLLKLLTKIIYPDKGEIIIRGRISSLLELGAGFHPDFTGRENIYFNSSIFGLTKGEIDRRIDEIIEFSELQEFIDNPVRSYSSGMYMRLAFATAINVDPDILLIDEVLAVGDTNFQKKCIEKIMCLKQEGKTIVFVSHDLAVVEKLCDKAVWLHDGQIVEEGYPRKIIDSYLLKMAENNEKKLAAKQRSKEEVQPEAPDESCQDVEEADIDPQRWGSREIEITDVVFRDSKGNERYSFESGERAEIVINYNINVSGQYEPNFGVGIFRSDGLCCYGTNTAIDKFETKDVFNKGRVIYTVNSLDLLEGSYYIDVAVVSQDGHPYDYHTKRLNFEVVSRIKDIGIIRLNHSWQIKQ